MVLVEMYPTILELALSTKSFSKIDCFCCLCFLVVAVWSKTAVSMIYGQWLTASLSRKCERTKLCVLITHREQRAWGKMKMLWGSPDARTSLVRLRGVVNLEFNSDCLLRFLCFIFLFSTRQPTMLSVSIPPPQCLKKPLAVPHRYMLGPGPSNVPPRISEAAAKPVIGHMHPEIFEVTLHTVWPVRHLQKKKIQMLSWNFAKT